MAEYKTPANSFAARNGQVQPQETPKAAKVVSGKVVLKTPSRAEKLKEDGKNALKSVIVNTIAPSVKDLILNAVWNGLSMVFFPDGSRKPSGYSPASRVSYYGGSTYHGYGSYYDAQPKIVNVSEPAFRNPIMASMGDANAVIDAMRDTIRTYGFATWGTLYELCGMDSQNWQGTTKYGWTSVESTTIATVHTADGQIAYELRMPKASPIDDTPF